MNRLIRFAKDETGSATIDLIASTLGLALVAAMASYGPAIMDKLSSLAGPFSSAR